MSPPNIPSAITFTVLPVPFIFPSVSKVKFDKSSPKISYPVHTNSWLSTDLYTSVLNAFKLAIIDWLLKEWFETKSPLPSSLFTRVANPSTGWPNHPYCKFTFGAAPYVSAKYPIVLDDG